MLTNNKIKFQDIIGFNDIIVLNKYYQHVLPRPDEVEMHSDNKVIENIIREYETLYKQPLYDYLPVNNNNGITNLMVIVTKGYIPLLRHKLSRGVMTKEIVDRRNLARDTVLHIAARLSDEHTAEQALIYLLFYTDSKISNLNGETAFDIILSRPNLLHKLRDEPTVREYYLNDKQNQLKYSLKNRSCDSDQVYISLLEFPEIIPSKYNLYDLRYIFNYLGYHYNLSVNTDLMKYEIEYKKPFIIINGTETYNLDISSEKEKLFTKLINIFQPCMDDYFGGKRYPLRRLTKYGQIGDKLGAGTYGEVFRLGNEYAIKIEKALAVDIINEISIMSRCYHPNIQSIVDLDLNGEAMGAIMKIADSDLNYIIKRRPDFFNKDNISIYSMQLLEGLVYMQKMGIWHRDIKPGNILYYSDENLFKYSDFGFSLSRPCQLEEGYCCNFGTRIYRAPEFLYGIDVNKINNDIWSVGVIFAEILIGGHLFDFNNENDAVKEISRLIGSPLLTWYDVVRTPLWNDRMNYIIPKAVNNSGGYLIERIRYDVPADLIDLIINMIAYPNQRIDVDGILTSNFFLRHSIHNCTSMAISDRRGCNDQLKIREYFPINSHAIINQKNIYIYDLSIIMNSLFELSIILSYTRSTFYHSYYIIISYLNIFNQLSKRDLVIVGFSAFWISSCVRNKTHMHFTNLLDFANLTEYKITEEELKDMILNICLRLNYNFDVALSYDYLRDLYENEHRKGFQIDPILVNLTIHSQISLEYSPETIAIVIAFINGINLDKNLINRSAYSAIKRFLSEPIVPELNPFLVSWKDIVPKVFPEL